MRDGSKKNVEFDMKEGMNDVRNLSYEELKAYVVSIGESGFRADQIFQWLYQKQIESFDQMRNLSSALLAKLKARFLLQGLKVCDKKISLDGTMKVLFELYDQKHIETVLIPTSKRATVCVSTQVGCKFGCQFCASGVGGWQRNLTCAEILNQVLYAKQFSKEQALSHIVFMGMGEPLDNYDQLIKAIRIINSSKGLNVAARRITVSTSGVIPGIEKLAKEGLQIELAVSLHASNDHARDVLMPINKKYPIKDLMTVCHEYVKQTKRQITFEYVLIDEVTATKKGAQELGRLLKGLLCKVNLIVYNPVCEFSYSAPSRNKVFEFKAVLESAGVHVTLRKSRGQDIASACGQLRRNRMLKRVN